MSPVALAAVLLVVAVVDSVLVVLLPHAASTNAPKLAALAPPAIFRKRLRSTSSRTRRSTIPADRGTESSPVGLVILLNLRFVAIGRSEPSRRAILLFLDETCCLYSCQHLWCGVRNVERTFRRDLVAGRFIEQAN